MAITDTQRAYAVDTWRKENTMEWTAKWRQREKKAKGKEKKQARENIRWQKDWIT